MRRLGFKVGHVPATEEDEFFGRRADGGAREKLYPPGALIELPPPSSSKPRRSSSSVSTAPKGEDEFFGRRDGGREKMYWPKATSSSSLLKPRRSFCRSSEALSIVNSRKSFSYDKLSQAPVHLTVVKLDGSSFGIEVIKMATIADLKQAVESVFSHLPTTGPGKISWRHVWTQFCLSYRGQKLLNDSEYIRNFGVRDGDELHFVRHVSIAYNLIKKRSTKRLGTPKPSTKAESNEDENQEILKLEKAFNDLEKLRHQIEENSSHNESMLSHLFRGWFLYSRVSSTDQQKFKGPANPSRGGMGGFAGSLRSWLPFCDKRHPGYSSGVSQVEI